MNRIPDPYPENNMTIREQINEHISQLPPKGPLLTKKDYPSEPLHSTHEEMVTVLAKSGLAILDSLTPLDCHLLHMVIGISGEAGELLDAVKKASIYRKPLDIENVIEELGDLEFYIQGLRSALDITREQTIQHNIKKLSTRYGSKYTNEAAIHRKDKA